MNTKLIDALTANLEDEVRVQDSLLDALRVQRRCLLQGESETIGGSVDSIRSLLDRSDRNRTRRASLLRSLGVDPRDAEPIETIACAIPEEGGARLRGLRGAVRGRAGEVRSLNRFNAQLVRRSAEVIESLLRVFTGLGAAPGYGLARKQNRLSGGGVLVNQEI
jgi:hypothetical protein